jgi:hypothetical protein
MSISRAFTTRRVKMSTDAAAARDAAPQRSNTTARGMGNPSIRHKISAPLELIHTTNMLSYNAPDIFPRKQSMSSSNSSAKSDDESDSSPATTASSPPTSPEVSPSERDDRSMSPEPNHLSCYFMAPGQASPSPKPVGGGGGDAPIIPQRAPSHTKKASYEAIARSRSNSALNARMSKESTKTISTKASFTFSTSGSRVSSASTAASSVSHNSMHYTPKTSGASIPAGLYAPLQQHYSQQKQEQPTTRESHPFGQELAQVSEIAEEYGVKEKLQVIDEEEQELASRGLCKFSADDYLGEIQGLFSTLFFDAPTSRTPHARPVAAIWI